MVVLVVSSGVSVARGVDVVSMSSVVWCIVECFTVVGSGVSVGISVVVLIVDDEFCGVGEVVIKTGSSVIGSSVSSGSSVSVGGVDAVVRPSVVCCIAVLWEDVGSGVSVGIVGMVVDE